MYTVTETNDFIAWAAGVWSDDERHEFITFISSNPLAGDVIPGAGHYAKFAGCVKAWANEVVHG